MKSLIAVAVVVAAFASIPAYGGTAQGHAYLVDETNHSGTTVEFYKYPNWTPCHTAFTNSSGYYSKTMVGGAYYFVVFTHPCHLFEIMDSVWVPVFGTVTLPDVTLDSVLCRDLSWCEDPFYDPPGSPFIEFPEDDGRHDPFLDYPIEWWYANFHLTSTSSGKDFGAFVSFFKVATTNGARLFSISDLSSDEYYSTKSIGGLLTASTTDLALHYSDGDLDPDRWWNRDYCVDSDGLTPWTYRLHVSNTAEEDGQPMELDLYMQPYKAPLMVGEDGLIWIGDGWSFYYIDTRVFVKGSMTVHGVTDSVTGFAWIDHQWGAFLLGEDVDWEWLSIQLDDLREIVVADIWVDKQRQENDEGLHLYDSDCSLILLPEYTLIPLSTYKDPVTERSLVTRWRVQEPTENIDLFVEADFEDQVFHVTEGLIFDAVALWEGACTVTGTIGGVPVNGKAYGESNHPRDSIYGLWELDRSPYFVCCDVVVPDGKQLTIEPGVQVLFTGHHQFKVEGSLKAMGTEQDTIVFSHYWDNEDSTWGGIRFLDASPACTLQYCKIEYGDAGAEESGQGGGIYCHNSEPVIRYCTISNNKAENEGAGVYAESSMLELDHCIIHHNTVTDPDGWGAGISCVASTLTLSRCTISDNASEYGCGVACWPPLPCAITATCTIIWDNECLVEVEYCDACLDATCCDIYGSWPGEGNIDCDPLFYDPESGDYRLQPGSCCIGACNDGGDIGAFGSCPGDANNSGAVDIDDVVYLIQYIFAGGPAPIPMDCCGDANGSGAIDIDDVVYLIQYIFAGGPVPDPNACNPPWLSD